MNAIQNFTEGAKRAVTKSAELASEAGHSEVTPLHLLWALIQDESRASEILTGVGVTSEALAATCPIESCESNDQDPRQSIPLDFAIFGDRLTRSSEYLEVLVESKTAAAAAGRRTEVGTEHLLYGLICVPSPASAALEDHGVDRTVVAGMIEQVTAPSEDPLAIDFAIRWTDQSAAEITAAERTMDAAANRAREGIRVVEDFVRFQMDDAFLTRLLKEFRHELSAVLRKLGCDSWITSRDTAGDVGTAIDTRSEHTRNSTADVVRANLKRLQEAVRTLEEFAKVVSPKSDHPSEATASMRFGKLRYDSYTLEKAIVQTLESSESLEESNLYLLVTEANCTMGIENVVKSAITCGVRIIQLREKEKSDREVIELGLRIREWTRGTDTLFIMNDRADLAVATEADGVHVGQEELSVADARRIVGGDRLVGVSTHNIEQARQAVLDGANYIGVGPCFPSQTKDFDKFPGLDFVQQVASEITLPWFAIGGISKQKIPKLRDASASRIAISSEICASTNPTQTIAELIDELQRDS